MRDYDLSRGRQLKSSRAGQQHYIFNFFFFLIKNVTQNLLQDKFVFSLIFSCLKMKLFQTFVRTIFKIFEKIFEIVKMFHFKTRENLADNQNCQAEFRSLCNKILLSSFQFVTSKYPVKFVTGQFTNSSLPTTADIWDFCPNCI